MTEADKVAVAFLLTEDKADAERGAATLRRVVEHLFKAIDENIWPGRFDLQPAPDQHQVAVRGTNWKSTRAEDRPRSIELCRYIATQLLRNDLPSFVFFHYDGDRKWSEHESSENRAKFEEIVRHRVKQTLLSPPPPNVRPPPRTTRPQPDPPAQRTEHEIDGLLGRLIDVVPFYSIESWLFRDFEKLAAFCAAQCGRHLAVIQGWQAGEPPLDEVEKPKDAMECFRDSHNHELAGAGFKRDDLYLLETSFYASVERARAAPGLVDALKKTAAG